MVSLDREGNAYVYLVLVDYIMSMLKNVEGGRDTSKRMQLGRL